MNAAQNFVARFEAAEKTVTATHPVGAIIDRPFAMVLFATTGRAIAINVLVAA